jgi:bis(5'-nucleosyl)-tetraphosphatase (symmetrical)
MTRYAIGDLQGCLQPLKCLLKDIGFDASLDELWLVGDLINRGPESLATLRFVKALGDCTRIVLGNHDLHFLAIAFNTTSPGKSDTFDDILAAHDRDELVQWLLQQPLMYSDPSGDYHMTHAGIPPIWSTTAASAYAREVEATLKQPDPSNFFAAMYGNQPDRWNEQLQGSTRLRTITNYFTRMRFCTEDGRLDFKNKLAEIDSSEFLPWFSHPPQSARQGKIIFGHWAALEGKVDNPDVFALDTGCVWGRSLTAMNLETGVNTSCQC